MVLFGERVGGGKNGACGSENHRRCWFGSRHLGISGVFLLHLRPSFQLNEEEIEEEEEGSGGCHWQHPFDSNQQPLRCNWLRSNKQRHPFLHFFSTSPKVWKLEINYTHKLTLLFWIVLVVQILGKCEFLNPGGSVKDRVAVKIIEEVNSIRSGMLRELLC